MSDVLTTVERMARLLDEGDVDGAVEQFAPDATFTNPLVSLRGRDEIRGLFAAFDAAFAEMRHVPELAVESGDTVALEAHVTGVHTGTLVGPAGEIPATGRSIDYRAAVFATVVDGQITSFRGYWDVASFMQQLGVAPEPAASTA